MTTNNTLNDLLAEALTLELKAGFSSPGKANSDISNEITQLIQTAARHTGGLLEALYERTLNSTAEEEGPVDDINATLSAVRNAEQIDLEIAQHLKGLADAVDNYRKNSENRRRGATAAALVCETCGVNRLVAPCAQTERCGMTATASSNVVALQRRTPLEAARLRRIEASPAPATCDPNAKGAEIIPLTPESAETQKKFMAALDLSLISLRHKISRHFERRGNMSQNDPDF